MYARFCSVSFMTLCVFMSVLWLRLWASVAFLFHFFYYFLGFFPFLAYKSSALAFEFFYVSNYFVCVGLSLLLLGLCVHLCVRQVWQCVGVGLLSPA